MGCRVIPIESVTGKTGREEVSLSEGSRCRCTGTVRRHGDGIVQIEITRMQNKKYKWHNITTSTIFDVKET